MDDLYYEISGAPWKIKKIPEEKKKKKKKRKGGKKDACYHKPQRAMTCG